MFARSLRAARPLRPLANVARRSMATGACAAANVALPLLTDHCYLVLTLVLKLLMGLTLLDRAARLLM